MTWGQLLQFLLANEGSRWWDDSVTVYAADSGEYFPADTIEFEDGDDIIGAGSVFIVIQD